MTMAEKQVKKAAVCVMLHQANNASCCSHVPRLRKIFKYSEKLINPTVLSQSSLFPSREEH